MSLGLTWEGWKTRLTLQPEYLPTYDAHHVLLVHWEGAGPVAVQRFVCCTLMGAAFCLLFRPSTPLKLAPRGRCLPARSPAPGDAGQCPLLQTYARRGLGFQGSHYIWEQPRRRGCPCMFLRRNAERPRDCVTGPFLTRCASRGNYVKQIRTFAWKRTSIADVPYYSIYPETLETSALQLLKTMWKLWITFRICMIMQSYGNCFTPLRPPEPLANPQAAPSPRPSSGPGRREAIRSV